ncbi:hypothetical protein BDR07DRAFT_151904 [Suillus spraguei]|nr:hypothetical protein BDR07DRAFT_151904 [Suillus spraguei]
MSAVGGGVGLVLLGGIMRGFHYDTNICASLDLFDPFGINSTDHLSTHAYRAKQAVARQVRYVKSLPSEGNTSFACFHCHPGIDIEHSYLRTNCWCTCHRSSSSFPIF